MTIQIMLDVKALERLIGGDDDVNVKLRTGVVARRDRHLPGQRHHQPEKGMRPIMSETMPFPTLYKKTSTGAQQEWTIKVVKCASPEMVGYGVIVTRWGQTGGKIQEGEDVIKVGKNIGKKNETSPFEQACAEAQSQWERKLKKGYVQNAEGAMAGEVDAIIEGGISPMLAHRFDEQGHKIKYPAYAQPKLDGHRCIAVVRAGKCTLWSRTRKPITSVPHIIEAVERMATEAYGIGSADLTLDGELYNHAFRDKFEELTSFIRQVTPKDGHEVVQYHIYDLADEGPFQQRLAELVSLRPENLGPLRGVRTVKVDDEDELMLAFDSLVAEGYEGAMVRNASGFYVNKRSYDLQKVKEFMDSEFLCVGVTEGRGKLAGHAIFTCRSVDTSPSLEFRAKMKGETAKLKEYFDHPERARGRMLTVKYQGLTKNGIPRFPVALRFKEEV